MVNEGSCSSKLGSRFEEALAYAARLHGGQIRKVLGTPYIAHLLSVAALVIEDGGGEDEAIAALLHDAIEDQGGDTVRQEIRRRFGNRVVAIVDGCSDADTVPKPPWRERKERFLASLAAAPPEVLRVAAADKLHNARSLLRAYRQLGEPLWERFRGGRAGTLWYHREVARAIAECRQGWLVDALLCAVDDLERGVEDEVAS
jgi:(p)ppGpp synthase/HD superfamily hydrolase